MIDRTDYQLRRPSSDDEWHAYHLIRRKALFENRGHFGTYNASHPDELQSGNHPLILVWRGEPIGVIRIDVRDHVAWFRRVAVREDFQRAGHGRVLLHMAENFARQQKCDEVRSNVALDAVAFYEHCGYTFDFSTPASAESVLMVKRLL